MTDEEFKREAALHDSDFECGEPLGVDGKHSIAFHSANCRVCFIRAFMRANSSVGGEVMGPILRDSCPKCGRDDFHVRWAPFVDGRNPLAKTWVGEILWLTCKCCGHSTHQRPLDYVHSEKK